MIAESLSFHDLGLVYASDDHLRFISFEVDIEGEDSLVDGTACLHAYYKRIVIAKQLRAQSHNATDRLAP